MRALTETGAAWTDVRAIFLDRIVIVSRNPVPQRKSFNRLAQRAWRGIGLFRRPCEELCESCDPVVGATGIEPVTR